MPEPRYSAIILEPPSAVSLVVLIFFAFSVRGAEFGADEFRVDGRKDNPAFSWINKAGLCIQGEKGVRFFRCGKVEV